MVFGIMHDNERNNETDVQTVTMDANKEDNQGNGPVNTDTRRLEKLCKGDAGALPGRKFTTPKAVKV